MPSSWTRWLTPNASTPPTPTAEMTRARSPKLPTSVALSHWGPISSSWTRTCRSKTSRGGEGDQDAAATSQVEDQARLAVWNCPVGSLTRPPTVTTSGPRRQVAAEDDDDDDGKRGRGPVVPFEEVGDPLAVQESAFARVLMRQLYIDPGPPGVEDPGARPGGLRPPPATGLRRARRAPQTIPCHVPRPAGPSLATGQRVTDPAFHKGTEFLPSTPWHSKARAGTTEAPGV